MTPNFESAYKKLNPEQKHAVDTVDGTVMVMAGPGTGKTQVLATRVAKILLEQDVQPQNILALTFTDSAAQNMRERIVSLIGTTGYYVNIMTFHSFASEVMNAYPERFPMEKGSEPLSDFERFEILEQIILNTRLEVIKPLNSPLYYITELLHRISELKREYISPEDLESILRSEKIEIDQAESEYWQEQEVNAQSGKKAKTKLSAHILKLQKNYEKQQDLLTVFTKYKRELENRKRYDFDDMIVHTVQAFEQHEDLLLDYQERFQYVLVDEYQDTNAAQNKIVELLASYWENPNLFVVGDPHQSIYRFQGASTENMLEFVTRYPEATVITLKTGYRCYQEVYDAAHTLISHNTLDFGIGGDSGQDILNTALTQRLESAHGAEMPITTFAADTQTLELFFIAEEIKRLAQSGVTLDEIAVLYRNNSEAAAIQEVLSKWGIECELSIGQNVLDNLLIIQLLNFLQVLHDLALGVHSELLFEVMQYDWIGLERVSVYKVARIASKQNTSIEEILEKEYSTITESYGLSEEEFATLVRFKNKALHWYGLSKNMLFHEWFSLFISSDNRDVAKDGEEKPDGFGYRQLILEHPIRTTDLYALNSLFSAVKQFVKVDQSFGIDTFLARVSVMKEHNLKIPVEDFSVNKHRVSLSTVHSAKGKEWEYVFVMGAMDGKWGNARSRELLPLPDSILTNVDISKKEKNEDDRRLFYVALTRASKQLYITWPLMTTEGKSKIASMFVTEVAQHTQKLDEQQVASLRQNSDLYLQKLLSQEAVGIPHTDIEREFFSELLKDFKLSVTALNNYLKDPSEFLHNSLLRVPRAKTPILSFGTAVHAALEQYYGQLLRTGKQLSKEQVVSQFDFALQRESLSQIDYQERLQHGKEVLDFYYSQVLVPRFDQGLQAPLFVEKFFGGKMNKTVIFDGEYEIQLSGRIDRVDLLDKHSKTIRVVDYKTGKPKSENVILGTASTQEYSERELALPETIRGRLQRQMVFYKLLAQLDPTFQYSVAQVEFDFVEPGGTRKDQHISRRFEVSDQAVEDLKQLIIEVMREIRELKFLDSSDIMEQN